MAMTVKKTTSNTITEYNTVTSGVWTLDFKKTVTGGVTTVVCYPKKSGTVAGFISYNVTEKTFMFQLNNQAKGDLTGLSAMFGAVCSSINEIS